MARARYRKAIGWLAPAADVLIWNSNSVRGQCFELSVHRYTTLFARTLDHSNVNIELERPTNTPTLSFEVLKEETPRARVKQ